VTDLPTGMRITMALRSVAATQRARRWLPALGVSMGWVWATTTAAAAEEWPANPVRIVVPFAAGGSSDQLARLLAPELSATFKQQFYVAARAGSRGVVGSAQVARAEP